MRNLTLNTTLFLLAFSSNYAAAGLITDYMVVTTLDPSYGDAFTMQDSEIGAIGFNAATSPPGSLPALPGGTARTVSNGITLDGDAAILNGGTVTFSNSDVHAENTGDANPSTQGVDCNTSFSGCTLVSGSSQISSSNRFNTTSGSANFSTLNNNNGIQGDVTHLTLADLEALRVQTDGYGQTGVIDLTSTGGQVNNMLNEVWDFTGGNSGLNVIDILTGDNDFYIANSNLTIKGDADDFIIFRIEESEIMNVSQSNLLLDGGIGVNNVLWYVNADQGEQSFNFNNVTFYGMALWDLGLDSDNEIAFNNVKFCGQVVTDQVDFQNVSGSGCTPNITTTIPEPSVIWLILVGFIGCYLNHKNYTRIAIFAQ